MGVASSAAALWSSLIFYDSPDVSGHIMAVVNTIVKRESGLGPDAPLTLQHAERIQVWKSRVQQFFRNSKVFALAHIHLLLRTSTCPQYASNTHSPTLAPTGKASEEIPGVGAVGTDNLADEDVATRPSSVAPVAGQSS